ncbi:SCO2322 family protein [Streptomyces zingiberis]|uniref:Secreted protein n=1 Tax=Streptomyces zingiberis TaxID=2053010 RepID=A0ABX1BT86_9ACTN|nr:SCO2322 family protein [Streptomyces zingiberis]NJP99620.1 hypothetical protein [Streptomyces zingiberis]
MLCAALVWICGASPAQAQGYRYWSFWQGQQEQQGRQGNGAGWAYATEGPATARPGDGDVAGFRFSVSADSGDAAQPRAAADFDAVCGSVPAAEGRKRVALVLDFGTAADAPDGERPPRPRTECATVPRDATAGEALAAVAEPLRYDSAALLCAIAGYPERGCGEQVAGTGGSDGTGDGEGDGAGESGKADGAGGGEEGTGDDGTGGGPSAGLFAGLAVLAALAAGAVVQTRRRRG